MISSDKRLYDAEHQSRHSQTEFGNEKNEKNSQTEFGNEKITNIILIVDDEPISLELLRNYLHDAGYKVEAVEDGETALKLVNHIKPDLILLDVMMPFISGFETCRRLKKNEVTKDTPIIFLSGKTDSVGKGLEIGAVDCITKPFQRDELIARVNKHLTISNLRKQLEAKNAQLQDYVYHLESIAALGKAISETGDIAQMMDSAMKITLSVFKCDRAWLLYPCDPNAPSWRVPIEVATPEYPGAHILNTDIPKEPAVSEIMKYSLSATGPIAFGFSYEHKIPSIIAKQFSVQSGLCLAINPKIGKPWLFGLHQCSYARVWTENEFKLFSEFGQQIGVSLGLSISFEELVKSEKRLSRERYHDFIGASMPMQTVYQMIDKVAASKAPILITGETGTGKELCAEAIHKESKRADKPFVVCNCAAIPENLQESHLFGHLKGAFTGANENRKGLVSKADGGTLFLDEIGELPLLMQSTLLRFMQTKTFSKVGNHQLEKVDVRFICATNRNLLAEVKAGRFREDLYHRFNVIEIELPALRKRGQDILLLAKFFRHQFAKEEQKDIQSFSAEAEKKLLNYEWFGNVRQLQNTIHNVVLLNGGKVITAEMLAAKLSKKVDNNPHQCNSMNCKDNLSLSHIARFSNNLTRPFEEIEKETILKTIEDCNSNVCKAARVLKISHGTIYNKLKGWKNKGSFQK